jgi:hypothetical protein
VTVVSGFAQDAHGSRAHPARGRPVTARIHGPTSTPAGSGSPRESRRSCRRRAARDERCSCLSFSTIASIASASWGERPARDNGSSPGAFRSRWRRWRIRSRS